MYQIMKSVSFCYGHRLLDYDGKCANIHGHNGRAEFMLAGNALNSQGILIDFSAVYQAAKGWIDQHIDHKLLLHQDDPLIALLEQHNEPYFMMQQNPTAENIAALLYEKMQQAGYPVIRVRLWETETCYAEHGSRNWQAS